MFKQPKLQHMHCAEVFASLKWKEEPKRFCNFKIKLREARRKKRKILLKKQNNICFYCGQKLNLSNSSIDHIIPKSEGGSENISNFVVACKKCNRLRSTIDFNIFCNIVTSISDRNEFEDTCKHITSIRRNKVKHSIINGETVKNNAHRFLKKERPLHVKVTDMLATNRRLRRKYHANGNYKRHKELLKIKGVLCDILCKTLKK